jgi:hypothetical protein
MTRKLGVVCNFVHTLSNILQARSMLHVQLAGLQQVRLLLPAFCLITSQSLHCKVRTVAVLGIISRVTRFKYRSVPGRLPVTQRGQTLYLLS